MRTSTRAHSAPTTQGKLYFVQYISEGIFFLKQRMTDNALEEKKMAPPLRAGKTWERITAFIFGVIFLIAILIIAIFISKPTEFQIFIFRIVVACAVGGIGAIIPGFISVNVSRYVRAGGAISLFVLVYLINPPALVTDYTPFSDSIRRAEAAFASQNYNAAITFLKRRVKQNRKAGYPSMD